MSCSSMTTILLNFKLIFCRVYQTWSIWPNPSGYSGPGSFHLLFNFSPEELPDCSLCKLEPQTLMRMGEQGVGYVLEMNVGFSDLDHSLEVAPLPPFCLQPHWKLQLECTCMLPSVWYLLLISDLCKSSLELNFPFKKSTHSISPRISRYLAVEF